MSTNLNLNPTLNLNHLRSIPGLKLPDPLPPVPQIIARLQTVIAETESIHRKYIGADVNKLTDDQLEEAAHAKSRLSVLKLRLDQLLAAYPEFVVQASACAAPPKPNADSPSMPSIKSTMSIPSSPTPTAPTEQNSKNTPRCDSPVDNQQTSSDADPTQCDAQATQPGAPATQCDPNPTQSNATPDAPNGRTGASPVPLDASSSSPASSAPLEPELQELALEFRDLRDQRSPLDHLTDAEHNAILELFDGNSYRAVARLLAKPRPIGLGLKTSEGSLRRFLDRRRRHQRRQEQRDKLAHAQQIAQQSGPLDGFLKASSYMLESRLLKATTDDQADPTQLHILIKSLTALRRQTLAERQQTHREKNPS